MLFGQLGEPALVHQGGEADHHRLFILNPAAVQLGGGNRSPLLEPDKILGDKAQLLEQRLLLDLLALAGEIAHHPALLLGELRSVQLHRPLQLEAHPHFDADPGGEDSPQTVEPGAVGVLLQIAKKAQHLGV